MDGNLGPREQQKRLMFGLVMLVVALGLTAVLIATGANRWWRLTVFLPFALAGHGLFQAREKT
jgi:hypothetical protein